MDPQSQLLAGVLLGGDYRIVRLLSRGGMGDVYVAEQVSTGRQRALKVMKPQLFDDERSRQRFVDEARVGARVESEHVVEVIAAGVDEATQMPWLAMELLQGRDLDQHVRERGPLPLDEVIQLFEQLGHALGQAHDLGIIHRDLKPENLFLATPRRRGAAPMLKILDFGIAAVAASDHAAATVTTAIGSPLWIAPEQMQTGAKLRPATDVWAMGLVAFTLLTGKSYWPAANASPFNLHALIAEILSHPLVSASERAASVGACVPRGFDEWFARCVDRQAERRFPNAAAAIDGLRTMSSGGVVNPATSMPHGVAPTAQLPLSPTAPLLPLVTRTEARGGLSARAHILIGIAVVALSVTAAVWIGSAFDRHAGGEAAPSQSSSPPAHDEAVAADESLSSPSEPVVPAAEPDDFGFEPDDPPEPPGVEPNPPRHRRARPHPITADREARRVAVDRDGMPVSDDDLPSWATEVGATELPSEGRASEELSRDQIREVVNRERGGIQRCYETETHARGHAPTLRIDVDLVIGSSGVVASATAHGVRFGNLHQCAERNILRWRFPASGGTTRASIPFIFQGLDPAPED